MKLIFRTKNNRYVEVRIWKYEYRKWKNRKRKLYWIKLFGGGKSEV